MMLRELRHRALGNSDDLILEHRCYNGACLLAGVGCVVSSFFNFIFDLHIRAVFIPFFIGLVYLYLYYLSRRESEYKPVLWLYVLAGSVLLIVTWIYNAGINGSITFVSMVALVAMTVVLKRRRLLLVVTVFLPIMTGMFAVEYFRPDLVVPYESLTQRFTDVFFTCVISTAVIFFVLNLILSSYDRDRRELDRSNRLLEEKMNDLSRINVELEDALDRVDTLSGLLPICSSCKKVRDDEGYWNQIENYIRKHSRASFTHGICPECAKRLYPDLQVTKRRGPRNGD